MSAQITYGDRRLDTEPGETILACLSRNGIAVPHSCCAGVCQSCLMQATDGAPPPAAQKGLKPALQQQDYFLACQCVVERDMTVALPDANGLNVRATLARVEMLNHNVMRLALVPDGPFPCEPGQYLTLIAEDGIARSYSIANNPGADGYIELHIRLLDGGMMSQFLRDNAKPGLALSLRGPAGACFYVAEGDQDYPVFLAGTGTGLAPILGVARQALARGHRGGVSLFHGALVEKDLYLVEALRELAGANPLFRYQACVLAGEAGGDHTIGNIEDIVLDALPADRGALRLFLCGAPAFVNGLRRKAFLKGVASRHIFADAFLPTQHTAAAA